MVGSAPPNTGALFLLAQDGAQPSADEAVKDAKQSRCGVFEIAKPSPQDRAEGIDDPLQALAPAAARHAPHLVLHLRQALLAHHAVGLLEPVSQQFLAPPRM